MQTKFDEKAYSALLERIYSITPSVQAAGFNKDSYKPGLEGMKAFGERLGKPWEHYPCIHVAGTNGKGSVASMLAAALAGGELPEGSWGPASGTGAKRGAADLRVGLYTSPHLLDFRERMKVVTADGWTMPSKEEVWEFFRTYLSSPTLRGSGDSAVADSWELDTQGLSFFEMTTGLAFWWFARQGVDWAVMEAGLGGRLDSTNVITPELSVITSIGLDHCALLGSSRGEIAYEKAGIFKPGVPALVAEEDFETAPVFYSVANEIGAPLYFANEIQFYGSGIDEDSILSSMDLRGPCQQQNLHTVLVALDILGRREEFSGKTGEFSEISGGIWRACRKSEGGSGAEMTNDAPDTSTETGIWSEKRQKCASSPAFEEGPVIPGGTFHENSPECGRSGQRWEDLSRKEAKTWKVGVALKGPSTLEAIERTAELTGLRGRWERLCDKPEVVCDIAHNPPALEVNFVRLRELQRGSAAGNASSSERAGSMGNASSSERAGSMEGRPLIIVYGIMADKDLAGIAPLMPEGARYLLAEPAIPRALPAAELQKRLKELRPDLATETTPSVAAAVERAIEIATRQGDGTPKAKALRTASEQAAANGSTPFVYIGGSTFVVTEAIEYFNARKK